MRVTRHDHALESQVHPASEGVSCYCRRMAKRGRSASVDRLLARLKSLDSERKAIIVGIKAAIAHVMDGEEPLPLGAKKTKAQAKVKAVAGGSDPVGIMPVRTRRAMSAEARAKISAAQKKRWAKQKRARASGA